MNPKREQHVSVQLTSFSTRPCLPDGGCNASNAVMAAKLRVNLGPVDECHQSHFGLDWATSHARRFEGLSRVITNGRNTQGPAKIKNEAVGLKLVKHPIGQTDAKSRRVGIC